MDLLLNLSVWNMIGILQNVKWTTSAGRSAAHNNVLIRSGEAPGIGWSRQMLYSGFDILPRSVYWSAYFNGRSDNTDVIRLRKTSEPHNMKLTANRSRFRLRSLFLAITVLAIGLAYFRTQYSTAYQQWLSEKDLISRLNESCSVTESKIKGTPWLRWLDSLTEDKIFLRATSVRINNGNSAPLQEIFNELKNFKYLENVMVSWQYEYNPSFPHLIEETIAEVEQQGKDALPHVEILVFAFDP